MNRYYDFIGDVHGKATRLEQLLVRLGYARVTARGGMSMAEWPSSSAT